MSENESTAPLAQGIHDFCKRTWWAFLIGGIASVAFGIMAFANPGIALLVLSIFFAASVLVDGVSNVAGALSNRDREGWWMLLFFGLVGVAAGLYLLLVPPASMLVLIWVVAFIALATGLTTISLGWRIRQEICGEWVPYLTGGLSVIFGALMVLRIDIGGLSVVYLIATWALVVGLLRLVFALRVRSLVKDAVAS